MKSKNLFLLVFLLISSAIYAQNESSKFEITSSVSRIDISADSIDELKDFDWDYVLESFKNNPPDEPVSLSFAFNENGKLGETNIDSFSFAVSGKSSEAEEILDKAKKIIREFVSKD